MSVLLAIVAVLMAQSAPTPENEPNETERAELRREDWQRFVDHRSTDPDSMLICNCGRGFGANRHILNISDVGIDVELAVYEEADDSGRFLSIEYACNGGDVATSSRLIELQPDEFLISSRINQLLSSEGFANHDFYLLLNTWRYPYNRGEWAEVERSESGEWYQRRFLIEFDSCAPAEVIDEDHPDAPWNYD